MAQAKPIIQISIRFRESLAWGLASRAPIDFSFELKTKLYSWLSLSNFPIMKSAVPKTKTYISGFLWRIRRLFRFSSSCLFGDDSLLETILSRGNDLRIFDNFFL